MWIFFFFFLKQGRGDAVPKLRVKEKKKKGLWYIVLSKAEYYRLSISLLHHFRLFIDYHKLIWCDILYGLKTFYELLKSFPAGNVRHHLLLRLFQVCLLTKHRLKIFQLDQNKEQQVGQHPWKFSAIQVHTSLDPFRDNRKKENTIISGGK